MSPDPVIWGFKAIKPFDAEHPVGSGTIVHYNPGDEVPASEWGRAEGFMVEAGSIMRYVRDVVTVPGQSVAPPPAPAPAAVVEPEPVVPAEPEEPFVLPEGASYPYHKGGPLWILSDGSRLKGNKASALAAQADLDVAAEADAGAADDPAGGVEPVAPAVADGEA